MGRGRIEGRTGADIKYFPRDKLNIIKQYLYTLAFLANVDGSSAALGADAGMLHDQVVWYVVMGEDPNCVGTAQRQTGADAVEHS